MKKAFIAPLTLVSAFMLPALALAATYQYVNTSGNLELVTADTAEQALAIPTDRDPHSGVELIVPESISNPNSALSGTGGTYLEMMGSTSALTRALVLSPNGTAALATNYENGSVPTVETGTWTFTGTNQVTVTLTSTPAQSNASQDIIVFTMQNTSLVATTYNQTLYGSAGLTFTPDSY
jgi:hypothetical protein